MSTKKLISISLMLFMCVVMLIGCSGNEKAPEQEAGKPAEIVKLKLAHTSAPNTAIYRTYEKFKEEVEARSGGQIYVDVFPSGQLGGDQDTVEATMRGSLDICSSGTNNMSPFTELFLFADLPYVMRSIEGAHKVYGGPIGKELKEKTEKELSLKLLFFADPGSFRDVMNTRREIRTPSDMRGLKFRSAASPIEQETIRAFGGAPTPIAWPETYMALEQGVVDGGLQQLHWAVTAGHQEIIRYITRTGGIHAVHMALMNLDRFRSLSPEHQRIIIEAADVAQKYNFNNTEAWNKDLEQIVKDAGVQFYTPTQEEMELWIAAGMTVYDKFADKVPREFIDRILAEQEIIQ